MVYNIILSSIGFICWTLLTVKGQNFHLAAPCGNGTGCGMTPHFRIPGFHSFSFPETAEEALIWRNLRRFRNSTTGEIMSPCVVSIYMRCTYD